MLDIKWLKATYYGPAPGALCNVHERVGCQSVRLSKTAMLLHVYHVANSMLA